MRHLIRILPDVISLLPNNARWRLLGLVPLMIIAALLEMVGLALVLPLVNAVAGTQIPQLPLIGQLNDLFNNVGGAQALLLMAASIALFYLLKNIILFTTLYAENCFVMMAVRDVAPGQASVAQRLRYIATRLPRYPMVLQ